ncbi:hypothetical protein [Clostridium estertheticum]|uniref:hypothetical protein n=1 Tax=Clostridium estertheticum TaxID=238834 RepID=UPI001C0E76C2|nr:hypothetical protein [Clostridium estertheticum]MBU3186802.1 hypothetical protein [Clostridium estertheticum]MBW9172734.1 hypothetical protein [Clostridium estertheticum]MBX4271554.1 hypothetical protein [Clostridium estertheticum]MCB2356519.1 hypothetical protein [Clostridium estertheticum]WAG43797.1 hypothetical protein LL065_24275 [Clostridium estertheticum]
MKVNEEKRGRMVLNAKDMPDDVYEILNKKAFKRALTPYIVEIIRDNQKYKLILEKLDDIESKIDNITLNGTIKKENDIKVAATDDNLAEGIIVENINEVISEMDESDIIDGDF